MNNTPTSKQDKGQPRRSGANKLDQARIERMAQAGEKAEDISMVLQIELSTVKNFMPKTLAPGKEPAKPKAKAGGK